ncbi:MAG: NHL repeat-containing protein, partial [Planctomycetota bacterium]
TYVQQIGSLEVTILPQEAIDAGAQWRVDGGAWQDSGYTEPNLAVGSHTVEYSVIVGWNEPNSETVQINDGQTTTTTGTYVQQIGSLEVTILPQAAIDAGAQWRVDSGTWQDSGYTEPNLAVGSHTVDYKPVAGWNEPNSETVQINNGQTTTTTGTYVQQIGSLEVTILPQEAIDAGAQWRVDGGTWQDSGYTEPNLTAGSHTVDYKPVTGWNEPNSQTVQINDGQTTTTSGTYIQTGSLQVTILPQEAIAAGAQWRVDGGTWRDSNDTEPDLAVGFHTVEYKPIINWNEPNNQTVLINFGQTTTTSGTYTQAGSLQVTILPQEAIAAGAQWRVDGGTWRDSDNIENNLTIGSHTVEYKPIIGWNEPNSQTVQINLGQTTTTSGTYTTQGGSLQVTILPQEAIDAGALWRVDGGTWRDSNYVETDIPIGYHAVEYKLVTGWKEPAVQIVQINYGQTTTTSGTYIPTGSLQVTILPQEAIDAEAKWRVDGGAWQDSGYTELDLALGAHIVEYQTIFGFNEPNNQTVQINQGQTTTTTGTYIQQTGSLQVTIFPQEAIDANAQWRVDGGNWQDSGYTEPNLTVGSHTVEYKPVAGWNEPNTQTLQINDGQTTTTTGTYVRQTGSLQVTISPQAVIDAGAQWRIVGGVWRDSNDTEPNLAIGSYTLEYKWIFGWYEPNSQTVQINDGQTTTTSGTYIQQLGSLKVIILPQEAVDANAQWRVDGGTWHDSNDTEPNLIVGTHTVEYSGIADWYEPNSHNVQINFGLTTTTTATYIRHTGSLQVTIFPQEAIDANAQWRVDGGTWHDSNNIATDLVVGSHTVEYKTIFGFDEPNSQTVQINVDQTTTTSGTYIQQKGSLLVTISPQEAIDGGAQWRVDGGIWRDSNDIATNLTVGSHTVEYKPITNNWKGPDSQTVQINDGLTTMVTGTYVQTGSLQVLIYPQAAIDIGAQWRVDGGAWRNSGYTEPNLPVGSHTIDYKPVLGWNEPNSRTVQINHGEMSRISGTYVLQRGALKVTILPQAAADAGAQWRVDSGAWQDSNNIVTNILVGFHTVEYKSITNWNTPANQTLQITNDQTTTTSGTYIPTGSLQVIILPQAAVNAGAQWRIDRGIWRDSSYIETGISVGTHTFEYKPINGWNTPPNETVQIEQSRMTTRIGTYIPKGSLQIKIFPQEAVDANAQWRVDGGAWYDSNEIVTGLVVGSHTVEYKPLTNWNEPNNQVVQIDYNDITIATGTYIPTGSLQVTILPPEANDAGAQWRVDGGIWRDTNDIAIGLVVGFHTVEYKPLTNWNSPELDAVWINHGKTTTTTGTYLKPIGSLQVIISPQEAIDANAQWRVDTGIWRDSNDIVTDLTIGTHRIEYNTIFGWDKPPNETLEIYLDQTTVTYGTYVRSTGSLQVTILPPEANDANAQWRVDDGAWHDSNDIVTDLLVLNTHTVEFKTISNWKEPNSRTVQIDGGQTTIISGTYLQAGSLQVTIFPQEAVDANAQWRVDGGVWHDSNDIETNLVVGSHTVEFKPLTNFNEPNSQVVQIDYNNITITTGTYIPTGSLQVTILPQEAVDANAQWRVDGGPWRNSNDIETDLLLGSHTVEFKTIFGFNEPNSQTVQINHAQTTITTGTYVQQRGSLQVIILPQAAIDANAQWRVDGGAWHDSNDTEPNLAVGLHTVEYKPITNWNEPNSETIMINYGLMTTTSGTYIQAGSVQVTISPQEAIVDGAQWRVDGRAWRDSNDIETNLAIGMHTVEYKQISSWKEPNSETLLVNFGQKTTTSGTYTQAGSLQVTISPQEAIDANAQWRIDGGTWQDSNTIVTNIVVGSHTVEYKTIFSWSEPNSQTVQIDHGQKTTTSGTYIRQIGSLQVIILPPEANDANAQWRVDGGAWRDSNDIVDLAVGSYTVEYKPITDFNEPNSQTVQINQDQTTSITGTYIPIGSLKVIILQPEALDPNDANNAGAQWRVDGGPWHDSNEIQTGIPVGSHTVEYKPIYGWNEPNSQTVQIDHAQMTTTTGTYIRQRGSLQVTILPQEAIDANAQWRVDGGPWHDSNDTEPNLAVGLHTVAYKPIANWIEPNSHTVQIDYLQTTAISKTYIPAGAVQVTIAPQEAVDANAQWRVDGGSWRNSNAISRPLTVGTHTVDYKPLPNWNEPNSHTVQINHGQVTPTSGTYIYHTGSLQVIILPPEANDANAQWRVDGGPWHDSNDTEPNLAVGFHTVEFKSIGIAWLVPAHEQVQIFNEQTTTYTITYIKRTPTGSPPLQWQINIGVSDWEYGESVQQTLDGGYIIVGHVFSNVTFDYDICLTKIDADGNIDWQKYYGGDDWDLAYSVVQTSDGGYAISGLTYSYGNGESDIYLLKISSTGRLVWDQYFGGDFWDEGYSLQETSDGGFVIVGTTRSFGAGEYDVYLIKTLSNGHLEFEQTFGGTGDDNGWSVQQTSDGGYIIAGYTESFGAGLRDIYLIKLDPGTELQWQKTYDGTNDEIGFSVQQTADGGYIITGFASYWCPFEGTYQQDVALIKTDPFGNEQWFNTYPGSDDFCSGDDIGYYVRQTSDGGYIIAGETRSYSKGLGDGYLIKTDPNGKKEWQKALGDEDYAYATTVQQTSDDGFIVAGTTFSESSVDYDMYLAKICPDGTSSADFNCDGIVYYEDLQVIANQWLQTPTFPSADIDSEFGDGLVDFFDFRVLAHDWLLETIAP